MAFVTLAVRTFQLGILVQPGDLEGAYNFNIMLTASTGQFADLSNEKP